MPDHRLKWVGTALVSLALGAAPALSQPPRVPVPIYASDSVGPCSIAQVVGADPPGYWLNVRAGPSMRHPVIARLRSGRDVYACTRRGNWFGIVFASTPGRFASTPGPGDCNVLSPRRTNSTYRGPCRSGWVHYGYLVGYADFISP